MKFNTVKKVQEAGLILGALGVIGFIGIIWLMIYGNLSGNLGYDRLTSTTTNESGYAINGTTYTLTGASTPGFVSLSVTEVFNATGGDGTLVLSGNYTVNADTGTITGSATRSANWSSVNVSYVVTYKDTAEQNTDSVIDNLTSGFLTFFGFSNTFFTIAAIVLLIFMLLGLLALVWTILQMQQSGKGGYADG